MDKEFKKYGSIENHYRGKYIDRFTSEFPDMITQKYIVTEKIHGANFSINIFNSGEKVVFGKRKSFLEPMESFMNYQTVMKQEDEKTLVDRLVEYAKQNNIEIIRVYGELFGLGVQKFDYKKINTPTNKTVRIFDIEINENQLTPIKAIQLLKQLDLEKMYVPIVMISNSLQEALDVNTKFRSNFSSEECKYDCEGVVIRPYDTIAEYNYNGEQYFQHFILKKKNENFTDKTKAEKISQVFVGSDEYLRLLGEYKSYFTKGRIESVFSKEGNIESPKQFSQYIKFMSEDVKEDFFKDHFESFKLLDDKEKKFIFKTTGQLTINLLKQYL